MKELFAQSKIDIHAPAWKIWQVLIRSEFNKEWIATWWPDIEILESTWDKGSPMVWELNDGAIGAEGKVISLEPHVFLQFTFKADTGVSNTGETITCRLDEHEDAMTSVSVLVGNFGDSPEHERYYPGAVRSWSSSLKKIKEIAERYS